MTKWECMEKRLMIHRRASHICIRDARQMSSMTEQSWDISEKYIRM